MHRSSTDDDLDIAKAVRKDLERQEHTQSEVAFTY